MKTCLVIASLLFAFCTAPVRAADPVFTTYAAVHIGIMVYDVVKTGNTLPTCEKAKQENPSAYALTHGGWGNGNVNGKNLKTCTE